MSAALHEVEHFFAGFDMGLGPDILGDDDLILA